MRTERAGQKNKHKNFLCQKQIHFPSKFEFLSYWRVAGNPRFLIFLVCCSVCAGLLEHALLAGWDLDPVDASVRGAFHLGSGALRPSRLLQTVLQDFQDGYPGINNELSSQIVLCFVAGQEPRGGGNGLQIQAN